MVEKLSGLEPDGREMDVHILVSGAKYSTLSISRICLALLREFILRDHRLAPHKIITTFNQQKADGRR